jgi:hypothetical protein
MSLEKKEICAAWKELQNSSLDSGLQQLFEEHWKIKPQSKQNMYKLFTFIHNFLHFLQTKVLNIIKKNKKYI